jgi:O-succinylbenzoic acid--CoA ligase
VAWSWREQETADRPEKSRSPRRSRRNTKKNNDEEGCSVTIGLIRGGDSGTPTIFLKPFVPSVFFVGQMPDSGSGEAAVPNPGAGLAVVAGSQRWTPAVLEARVRRRVVDLGSQGLAAGELVLVPEAAPLDLLIMQHALVRLACGLFPVPARQSGSELERAAGSAGVEWLWRPDQSGSGRLEPTGQSGAVTPGRSVRAALLVETSGSEGEPKAVMLTRENLTASARLVNARLGLRAGDVWLSCLPRHHVGGLMIAYRCAQAGATLLLHEGFDAAAVTRDLVQERVTHLSLVPPMLARLMEVAEAPPPGLRVLLIGGQALGSALAREALAAGWPLHVTYGMTETASQVATSSLLESPPSDGLVGPVLPGVRVRCGGTARAPARIRLRGGVVMAGYASPERLPGVGLEDGWFLTSDLGYLTAGGALAVLGRADDVLMIGGEAVLASRVEERLSTLPGLDSLAVLGVPDPVWGHRLVAVYTGALGPEAVDGWCRQHVLGPLRPRELRRLDRLPVLASGKPDRRAIRRMLAGRERADSP